MNIFFSFGWFGIRIGIMLRNNKKTIVDKNNKVRLYSIYKLRKYSSSLLLSFLY